MIVQVLTTSSQKTRLIVPHIAHCTRALKNCRRFGFCTMASSAGMDITDISNSEERYQEAIKKLNLMQSTPEELEQSKKIEGAIVRRVKGPQCVVSMQQFVERCGITMEDINQLPIIHVAGTKGKGSVCAFCETILRKYGLKTGLITSPHLIEVRERIRINGKPVDYKTFSDYFAKVFSLLDRSKAAFQGEMPAYNRMTAVMGLYILLEEKVDVAILETGCGGEYDYTNFIRKPIVTGITSLGMDHLVTLGNTLTKIAWHKAGIFKPGRPAFTVPQPREGMDVISQRAKEIGTTVQCVPSLERNSFGREPLKLGLHGRYQYVNAALAIKLCQKFLEETQGLTFTKGVPEQDTPPTKRSKSTDKTNTSELSTGADMGLAISDPTLLPDYFVTGLSDCYWPGRSHTVRREQVTYYLDGAHTARSIEACVDWFLEASGEEERETEGGVVKILLFNIRLAKFKPSLVKPLLDCNFHAAVFCPNFIYEQENPEDLIYKCKIREKQLAKSKDIKQMFESLQTSLWPLPPVEGSGDAPMESREERWSQEVKGQLSHHRSHMSCVWLPSISSALSWAACGKDPKLQSATLPPETNYPERSREAVRIQVLVTGSLYLVGGVLKLLDPELAII